MVTGSFTRFLFGGALALVALMPNDSLARANYADTPDVTGRLDSGAARRARNNPDLSTSAELPLSEYGGYIVIGPNKQVLCWASKRESQPCLQQIAEAVQGTNPLRQGPGGREHKFVKVTLREPKVAAVPLVAAAVAIVACGSAGYVGASLNDQQNTILTVDAADAANAAVHATGGVVSALGPAKAIVKAAMPHAGMLTRITSRLGIAGAICAASAAGGVQIYHFIFRSERDIGAPAR